MSRRFVKRGIPGFAVAAVLTTFAFLVGRQLASPSELTPSTPPTLTTTGQLRQAGEIYLPGIESLVARPDGGFLATTPYQVVAVGPSGEVAWRLDLEPGQWAFPSRGGEYIAISAPFARSGLIGPLEILDSDGVKVAEFPWPLEHQGEPLEFEKGELDYFLWVSPAGNLFASAPTADFGEGKLTLYDTEGRALSQSGYASQGGFSASFSGNGAYFFFNAVVPDESAQVIKVFEASGNLVAETPLADTDGGSARAGWVDASHTGEIVVAIARDRQAHGGDRLCILSPQKGLVWSAVIGSMPNGLRVSNDGSRVLLTGTRGASLKMLGTTREGLLWSYQGLARERVFSRSDIAVSGSRVAVMEGEPSENLSGLDSLRLALLSTDGRPLGECTITETTLARAGSWPQVRFSNDRTRIAVAVPDWLLVLEISEAGAP